MFSILLSLTFSRYSCIACFSVRPLRYVNNITIVVTRSLPVAYILDLVGQIYCTFSMGKPMIVCNHVPTFMCALACTHTHTRTHVHACTCTYTHVHAHTDTHTHTHTQTHTRTHTHTTHTYLYVNLLPLLKKVLFCGSGGLCNLKNV